MDLGVKALQVPDFKIKSALYDHKESIQAATQDVLFTWLKQQSNRQTAYTTLHTALLKCDAFRSKAAELEQWVMGTEQKSHISQESKYKCIKQAYCTVIPGNDLVDSFSYLYGNHDTFIVF